MHERRRKFLGAYAALKPVITAGANLARYAQESVFLEDCSQDDNRTQINSVTRLALAARLNVDFCDVGNVRQSFRG